MDSSIRNKVATGQEDWTSSPCTSPKGQRISKESEEPFWTLSVFICGCKHILGHILTQHPKKVKLRSRPSHTHLATITKYIVKQSMDRETDSEGCHAVWLQEADRCSTYDSPLTCKHHSPAFSLRKWGGDGSLFTRFSSAGLWEKTN